MLNLPPPAFAEQVGPKTIRWSFPCGHTVERTYKDASLFAVKFQVKRFGKGTAGHTGVKCPTCYPKLR